jgi:multiple sugar transport system substrate-binding protein
MRENDATQGSGSGGERAALSRRSVLGGGMALGGAALMSALAACGSGGTGGPGGAGGSGAASGSGSPKGQTVTVWWNSGFYPEEDQAVKAIASDWESKSGNKVDLQFYSTKDLPTKEQSAVTSGVLPDVVEAENGNTSTYAYQGQLADVSDVVTSVDFTDGAKRAVHLYNSKTSKVGYYAVPIDQFTVPLFYWKDLLTTAGGDPSSLPSDWDAFWKVFQDAQGTYRSKTGKQVYAVGWPMSTSAGDTHYDTQMAMMAFGAQVLDDNGGLNVDDPKVKAAMIKAITWLTDLYKNGYTPKDVVNWGDSDNNTAFSNKSILITPNGSLSIPGSVKGKDQTAWQNIVTQPFPNKPDGSGPVGAIAQVHNAVVFENSPHKAAAIDFLKFFVQPDNTLKFLKGGQGRWHPVQTKLLQDDYFARSDDPNIAVATKMLTGKTTPAWLNLSVAYNHAELQGMWGNALGQVVLQGKSPSDAADYAIGQLKQAFKTYPSK